MSFKWNRRQILSALSASMLLPNTALGFGSDSRFHVAEIDLGRGTLHRPQAWKRMLHEIIQATSIEANPISVRVDPKDPALFEHPFAVLVGEDALPPLEDEAVHQLRRYLSYGGFLLIDDATGTGTGAFAKSARELARRVFPTRPLSPLPGDHALYRSFFLLDRPMGRTRGTGVIEGIQLGPTAPLMFCPCDLSGALDRGADGRNTIPLAGGETQRREAVKLSINLALYALTSNYKHDIAHVVELMRGGRIE